MQLILDNIRSAHNVGAMFRTADGAGVERIYLCGHTPAPIDRFGRVRQDIAKTALGATATIPWEVCEVPTVIQSLQQKGITIVALEQTSEAVSLCAFTPPPNVAYVVGNEVTGVSAEWLAAASQTIEIPMCGQKESLNVAVATGIMLYHDYCIRTQSGS